MTKHEISSLRRKLKKARENCKYREIYEYCCALAACLTEDEEYEEVLGLYKESLKASETIKFTEGITLANRMIAETCISLGYFDEALQHVNVFLNYAQNANNKVEEQRGFVLKGHVFFTQAEYLSDAEPEEVGKVEELLEKSMDAYRRSFAICVSELSEVSEKEKLQMKARLLQNKSLVLIRQNKLEQARNHLIRALKICAKEKLKDTECMCYLSLGDLYLRKAEYENALHVYDKAYELSTTAQRKTDAVTLKAKTCLFLNNLEKAKEVLKKYYKMKPNNEIKKLLKNVVRIMRLENELNAQKSDESKKKDIFREIGNIFCSLKILNLGIKYYLNMLAFCQKFNADRNDLLQCYKLLCEALKKDKQYDKALFYHNQEIELLKKDPERACKTYYKIAKLHELNNADFEEIYCAYLLAKTKCDECKLIKLKFKCLEQVIKLAKKRNERDILEKTENELEDLKRTDFDSSCESSSDHESETSYFESCNEENASSDIDLQIILHESENENEEYDRPKERSKRKKFSIKRNEKGETDLHVAAIKGNYRKVKSLLDRGHPVNVRDAAGWTPLHEACNHGYVDIVNILLDHGANINDRGGPCCEGITPLHDAAINGQMEVINILIKRKASVLVLNDLGETPLQCLLKWKKTSALDGEEETVFKNIVRALKSPLDGVQSRSQNNADPVLKKSDGGMDFSDAKLSDSPLPNSRFAEKPEEGKKSSAFTRRKRLKLTNETNNYIESDESDISEEPKNEACQMYRDAIDNLRRKPKKFKNMESVKDASRRALIDADKYVENCIMETDNIDDDDDDDGDGDFDANSDESGVVNKKFKSNIGQTCRSSSQSNFDIDFSDLEEDCIERLMEEIEMPSCSSPKIRPSLDSKTNSSRSPKENRSGHRDDDSGLSELTEKPEWSLQGGSTMEDARKVELSSNRNDSGLRFSEGSSAGSAAETWTRDKTDVHVKMGDREIKISVKREELNDLKLDRLICEIARHQSFPDDSDHHVYLRSETKPFISKWDSLKLAANEKLEIVVKRWKFFELSERYEAACRENHHPDISEFRGLRFAVVPQVRDALKNSSSSRQLKLSNLKLSSLPLIPICKAIKYEPFLQVLNLSDNYFGDKGFEFIVKILDNCLIEELNLSGCNITSSGVYYFRDSLDGINSLSKKGLQILNLSRNPITEDAMEAFNDIVENLPNLTFLNIENCELEMPLAFNSHSGLKIAQGKTPENFNVSS